jgi:hypothetical protein
MRKLENGKRENKPPFGYQIVLSAQILFEGHIRTTFGCTDSRCSMANLAVGDSELPERVSNHLGDDFDAFEVFAIMDADGEIDHLRQDNHITAMSANHNVIALSLSLASLSQLGK